MKILLLGFNEGDLRPDDLRKIVAIAPGYELLVSTDRQQIEAHLPDIEVAVKSFPYDLIPQAANLRWIQQWGAGVDWLLRHPEATTLDRLTVTNGSGIHPVPITEHILGLILAFGRGIHTQIRQQANREWQSPTWDRLFELPGKTLLLIGVGAIGERTAQMATALGMRVLGVRRDPAVAADGVAAMYGPASLPELLPQADIVVLTVPLTHETRHIIGEAELRVMKPTAYLINIGRGGTIDEAALIRALQTGWIAGAGLDVVALEPLPQASPLWAMENVIITAHYAGATPIYDKRAMPIFLDNLRRYVAGEPLHNVVDKALGY